MLNKGNVFHVVIKSHLISPCSPDIQYKYEKFQNSVCYVHIVPWVLYDCLASWKKDWFLRFSMSLLITYLITLSLEKEIIVLEKRLEKVFGSKNLYEHCT